MADPSHIDIGFDRADDGAVIVQKPRPEAGAGADLEERQCRLRRPRSLPRRAVAPNEPVVLFSDGVEQKTTPVVGG